MSDKSRQNLLLLLAMILLIPVFYPFVRSLNVSSIPVRLNPYSNLILALLTAILVVVTAFYARVTNRMLVQMKESRQSLVRPILWATFDRPEFEASANPDDKSKRFCTKVHIANYGKGAAVNIRTQYSIPDEWSDEHRCVMPTDTSGSGDLPFLLAPGHSFEVSVGMHTKTHDLNLHPKYLTARVIYEDTERNLYHLQQSYYLLKAATPNHYYLHIETESLHVIPFDERSNVRDETESLQDQGTVVFSRRLPWKWPTSKGVSKA